jgi:hypothetical protein
VGTGGLHLDGGTEEDCHGALDSLNLHFAYGVWSGVWSSKKAQLGVRSRKVRSFCTALSWYRGRDVVHEACAVFPFLFSLRQGLDAWFLTVSQFVSLYFSAFLICIVFSLFFQSPLIVGVGISHDLAFAFLGFI